MQSATVFSALDIFAAAGGNILLVKSENVSVITVSLEFRRVLFRSNPIVSAIEIVPLSGTDPAPISVSLAPTRSEERRVGKECRTATVPNDEKKKGVTW